MKPKRPKDFETATVRTLRWNLRDHGPGLEALELDCTEAPLRTLKVAPRVFQPRNPREEFWTKERHIEGLVEAILNGARLPPIKVFPLAGWRIVVDGHCRVEAYQKAYPGADPLVPVEHLGGTLEEAVHAAVTGNNQDKLPLTTKERMDAAWKLVLLGKPDQGGFSKEEIHRQTRVSHRQIGYMRGVLAEAEQYEADNGWLPEFTDPRGMRWSEVLTLKRGGATMPTEEKRAAQVDEWAKLLRKHFHDKPGHAPEDFMEALELAQPHFVKRMKEKFRDELSDEMETWGDPLGDDED